MSKNLEQHAGELELQRRLGVPSHVSYSLQDIIEPEVEGYSAHLLSAMPFVAFACCEANNDLEANAVGSLLFADQARGKPLLRLESSTRILVTATIASTDPLAQALRGLSKNLAATDNKNAFTHSTDIHRKFALLGIDMMQRRRIKLNGTIVQCETPHHSSGAAHDGIPTPAPTAAVAMDQFSLTLDAEECMGNCPKYITVRQLRWVPATSPSLYVSGAPSDEPSPKPSSPRVYSGTTLSSECIEVLRACSTAFLSTMHTNRQDPCENDVGINHRGGPKGFIRHYISSDGKSDILVIPDYSGNRFYQSLGNVQTNPRVHLTVLDFISNQTLAVEGIAANLMNGDADALMPHATLVTTIAVVRCSLQRGTMPLEQIGDDKPSPYNPPLRLLASELSANKGGLQEYFAPSAGPRITATLVSAQKVAPTIGHFVFRLSQPMASYLLVGGSHIILDCSTLCPPREYKHMDERCPQRVNDDRTRVWTMVVPQTSEAVPPTTPPTTVELYVRLKRGGLVTPSLHAYAADRPPSGALVLPVRGGGNRVDTELKNIFREAAIRPETVLFLIGGVGCSLLLSMLAAPIGAVVGGPGKANQKIHIAVSFSRRHEDSTMDPIISHALEAAHANNPTVLDSTHSFRVIETPASHIGVADLEGVPGRQNCVVVMCGPPAYTAACKKLLVELGVDPGRVVVETFDF